MRNIIVHESDFDHTLFDKELKTVVDDVRVAIDRIYDALGTRFDFEPIRDY